MIKNPFYFILKAPFVLNIFKFLSWLFGHVREKWIDNYNSYISQYLTELRQPDKETWSISRT